MGNLDALTSQIFGMINNQNNNNQNASPLIQVIDRVPTEQKEEEEQNNDDDDELMQVDQQNDENQASQEQIVQNEEEENIEQPANEIVDAPNNVPEQKQDAMDVDNNNNESAQSVLSRIEREIQNNPIWNYSEMLSFDPDVILSLPEVIRNDIIPPEFQNEVSTYLSMYQQQIAQRQLQQTQINQQQQQQPVDENDNEQEQQSEDVVMNQNENENDNEAEAEQAEVEEPEVKQSDNLNSAMDVDVASNNNNNEAQQQQQQQQSNNTVLQMQQNNEMDHAAALLTVDPQLRMEMLMEQNDASLRKLPSNLLAEAIVLRNRRGLSSRYGLGGNRWGYRRSGRGRGAVRAHSHSDAVESAWDAASRRRSQANNLQKIEDSENKKEEENDQNNINENEQKQQIDKKRATKKQSAQELKEGVITKLIDAGVAAINFVIT